MATREELTIALGIMRYLNNAQRDMRSNAQGYLAEIAAGHPRLSTAQLGVILRADGAAISVLMAKMGTFLSDPGRTVKATAGVGFFGMTSVEVNTDRLMIKAAADTQAIANVVNDAAITDAANATLAALPAIDTFD